MKKVTLLNYCGFLVALFLSSAAGAQNLSVDNGATQDACLGPQLTYKQYARDIMAGIQNNLWTIYHEDADWQSDTRLAGSPLSDGIMGPITWSWMNRFCKDYSLSIAQDMTTELPEHLNCIATFSDKYTSDHKVLISHAFSAWHNSQSESERSSISAELYKCNEADLKALVQRFLSRDKTPNVSVIEKKLPNTLYIYVLRADDFAKLQQPNPLPAAINSLVDKPFASESEADAAITKTLAQAKAPKELQPNLLSAIRQHLSPQVTYQFNEANLSALASSGLSAVQITELNKLPKDVFTSEEKFKELVEPALAFDTNAVSSTSQSVSSDAALSASLAAEQQSANATLALIRVVNATKTTSLKLGADAAEQVIHTFFPDDQENYLNPTVVKALRGLQDIEYPDGELLHSAAIDKIVKELAVCDENDSNSLDTRMAPLNEDEKKILRKFMLLDTLGGETKALLSETPDPLGQKVCHEGFIRDMHSVYAKLVQPAIQRIYRKDAPAYSGKNILWDGSECGCIPKEISSTAYGIYPFWQVNLSEKAQNFDFSTFSRVGYYGLSFNGSGQLTHANTNNRSQTILDENSKISSEFISKARTYGSKVDWVIEKDWNEERSGQSTFNPAHLREVLNGLHNSILNLLKRPMPDSASKLRPWLSLGISPTPTFGDGVTLYFKNYPQDAETKPIFESFFKTLKLSLKDASYQNNKWHSLKQDYFVNLIVAQDDYINPENLFSATNLFGLLEVPYDELSRITVLKEQELTKTLILVLLKDPYFNSLSELYAGSNAGNRGYVLPTVFMDYRNFSTSAKQVGPDKRAFYDERRKNISFQREAFGGGAFWAMPTWDAPDSGDFNIYVADHFALGYPSSIWDAKICAYRWAIIAVMNIWLCIALLFVLFVFYIFPLRCNKLPGYLSLLSHPIVMGVLILPPIGLWIYIMVVDILYPVNSVPTFLCFALIGLSAWAVINYVTELRQRKPTRNVDSASVQKLPARNLPPKAEPDDNDFVD